MPDTDEQTPSLIARAQAALVSAVDVADHNYLDAARALALRVARLELEAEKREARKEAPA